MPQVVYLHEVSDVFFCCVEESRNPFLFIVMCRGALLVTYLLFIDFGIARKKGYQDIHTDFLNCGQTWQDRK